MDTHRVSIKYPSIIGVLSLNYEYSMDIESLIKKYSKNFATGF
jgi:hypothetical protein